MKNAIKFLVVLLLLLGCDKIPLLSSENGSEAYDASKITDGVRIELDIKSKKIMDLHDIKADFSLKNISDRPITYGFPSGCQSGYKIKRNQDIIFDSTRNMACITVLTSLSLEPGETKTMSISLELRENKELEQGRYKLEAFLLEDHGIRISTSFTVQ